MVTLIRWKLKFEEELIEYSKGRVVPIKAEVTASKTLFCGDYCKTNDPEDGIAAVTTLKPTGKTTIPAAVMTSKIGTN